MTKKQKINVDGLEIVTFTKNNSDFISLTDIARHKNPSFPADVIKNWMRTRGTIDFLGLWEKMYNPNFKLVEFDQFKNEAGTNSFVLPPQKWIEKTHAIGLISKSGRYGGGTFAHKDIAFEFASWVSAEFKLYLIVEFQRLKQDENSRLKLEWNLQRTLAKINYKIHTDAIKENLIPHELTKEQACMKYANEADLLNMALFGITAKMWREQNPELKGNIRDYTTIEQLVVLSNLESINALLIRDGLSQQDRILKLNNTAIIQMKSLLTSRDVKKLESPKTQ
ncbi:KilA-N domain-containing protein [Patescibacteria group bacterium]|nr:KilA-N domain-containing protein [Patescibacteria group bacterium]